MPPEAPQVCLRSREVAVEGRGSSWSWCQVLACGLSVWRMGEHRPRPLSMAVPGDQQQVGAAPQAQRLSPVPRGQDWPLPTLRGHEVTLHSCPHSLRETHGSGRGHPLGSATLTTPKDGESWYLMGRGSEARLHLPTLSLRTWVTSRGSEEGVVQGAVMTKA